MSLEIIFDKDFYANFSDYKRQSQIKDLDETENYQNKKEIDLSSYDYFKEINVSFYKLISKVKLF